MLPSQEARVMGVKWLPLVVVGGIILFAYGYTFNRYSFHPVAPAGLLRCSQITGECERVTERTKSPSEILREMRGESARP